MIKKIYILIKLARKIALSDAINKAIGDKKGIAFATIFPIGLLTIFDIALKTLPNIILYPI